MPFGELDLDVEAVLAELRVLFAEAVIWRGEFTGGWWTYADDRLIEARTPGELRRILAARFPAPGRQEAGPAAADRSPPEPSLDLGRPCTATSGRHARVRPQRRSRPVLPQRSRLVLHAFTGAAIGSVVGTFMGMLDTAYALAMGV